MPITFKHITILVIALLISNIFGQVAPNYKPYSLQHPEVEAQQAKINIDDFSRL